MALTVQRQFASAVTECYEDAGVGSSSEHGPTLITCELRQHDLPIGSGAVESAAKHLVQQRMKRAGMRGSDLAARAILDLRCHLLSGRSLAQPCPSPTNFG